VHCRALARGASVCDGAGAGYVAKFLESFKEFPPRQKPGSFSIDQVMESIQAAAKGGAN
jgi:hypothetical protein